MKKRVLVIGSSGMLGVDLCEELSRRYAVCGADVAGPRAKDAGARGKGQGAGKTVKRFVLCDILKYRDVAEAIRKTRPDAVILTAAMTDVDGCERDPKRAYRVNADGAGNVARACRDAGLPLIFVSTDFVFNGRKRSAYRETDKPAPLGVYGDSKLRGERVVRKALREHIIVRTSWLYGAYGKNFVDTIVRMARTQPCLKVVDDQVGSPTSTRDLAKALGALIDGVMAAEKPLWGTYHCSNAGHVSWYRYAKQILRLARLKTKVLPISSRQLCRPARRPKMSVLDCGKLRDAIGLTMPDWNASLKEYLGKTRKQPSRVKG